LFEDNHTTSNTISLNNTFHKTNNGISVFGNHGQRNPGRYNEYIHCMFYARGVNRNLKQNMHDLLKKGTVKYTYMYTLNT